MPPTKFFFDEFCSNHVIPAAQKLLQIKRRPPQTFQSEQFLLWSKMSVLVSFSRRVEFLKALRQIEMCEKRPGHCKFPLRKLASEWTKLSRRALRFFCSF